MSEQVLSITVNNIMLRAILYQGNVFTSGQVDTLQEIAAKCPKTGGHGVYKARGLLHGCNEGAWDDNIEECYPKPEQLHEQVLDPHHLRYATSSANQSTLYPNPSNGRFFIQFPNDQSGRIILTDALGQIWKDLYYPDAGAKDYVELKGVPSGIYICSFYLSSGGHQSIKVFIN